MEELDSNTDLMELFKQAAPGPLLVTDDRGHVLYLNAEAEAFVGYRLDELSGKSIELIVPSSILSSPHAMHFGENLDFFITTKEGSVKATELFLKPCKMGQSSTIVISLKDQTKHFKKVQKLKKRVQDIERFTIAVSDTLMRPLKAILSNIAFIKASLESQFCTDAHRYFEFVSSAGIRLADLLRDIKSFLQPDFEQRPESIECSELLKNVLQDLKAMISEREAVIKTSPLPTIRFYRFELTELFQNLITNAIKYTPVDRRPHVEITCEEKPHAWVFSVADNGIGVPKKHFKDIFKLFERLHTQQEYPGTGVGLAICKRILQKHGGSIWVDSKEGKGSTFYFSVPKGSER